jgi:hypothetical protein
MARCGSFPHCRKEAAQNDKFCAVDRAKLDAIMRKRDPVNTTPKVPPSAVTITNQENTLGLRAAILAALKDGPLSGQALAAACGTETSSATYVQTRQKLRNQRRITATGTTRAALWALAASNRP